MNSRSPKGARKKMSDMDFMPKPIRSLLPGFLSVAALIAVNQEAEARIQTPGARSTGPFVSGAVAPFEAQMRKVAPVYKAPKPAKIKAQPRNTGDGFHPFAGLRGGGKTAKP